MAYDYNIGGQGALTGAIGGAQMGTMIAPGIGTAIGGLLGAGLGALGGIGGEQKIPDFNAADYATNYLERFGGYDQEQKQVEANADAVKRRTMAELISGGADPVDARRIAEERSTNFRQRSMGDLLNAAMNREAQLTQQLLPTQLQREEDQISLRNLQSAQKQEAAMDWGATLLGGGLTLGEMFGVPSGGLDGYTNNGMPSASNPAGIGLRVGMPRF